MKRQLFFALLTLALVAAAGCSRGTSRPASTETPERAAIRTALEKYLNERGTLNMAAMDMVIKDVKFDGDRAEAHVEFRAKGMEGAGMDMAYLLERQGAQWVVKSGTSPEVQTHPPVGQPEGGALPPSHPPITPPKKE